jgi:hypothetical protein
MKNRIAYMPERSYVRSDFSFDILENGKSIKVAGCGLQKITKRFKSFSLTFIAR